MKKSTKKLKGKRVNGILYLDCIEPDEVKPKKKKKKGYYFSLRKNLKRQ